MRKFQNAVLTGIIFFCGIFYFAGRIMSEQVDPSFGDLDLDGSMKVLLAVSCSGSMQADKSDTSVTIKKSTVAEYIEGRKSKQAAVISKSAYVDYQFKKPLNASSGTVMFWIKPLNWSGTSASAQTFITLNGAGKGKEPQGSMALFVNSAKTKVLIVTSSRKTGYAEPVKGVSKTGGVAKTGKWAQGKWYHVAYTWNKKETCLYVDGVRESKIAATKYLIPGGFTRMTIGNCWNWCGKYDDAKTAIQGIMIVDKALSANEVREMVIGKQFKAVGEDAEGSIPLISVVPGKSAPVIDGSLKDSAWKTAMSFPGFIDNTTRAYSSRQTIVKLLYDSKKLYIAMESPVGGKALEKNDFSAVIVRPSGMKEPLVLAVRPDGSLTDAGGKPVPGKIAKAAAKVVDGKWQVEMAVDYAGLGIEPPKPREQWEINFCRRWNNPQMQTSWCIQRKPGLKNINPDEMAILLFNPESPVIQISSFDGIRGGKPGITSRVMVTTPEEFIYVFTDTLVKSKQFRGAHSTRTVPGKFCRLDVQIGPPGTGHMKKAQFISYSFLNKGFKRVYFRTQYIPVGKPALIEVADCSFETRKILKVTVNTVGIVPMLLSKTKLKIGIFDGKKQLESAETSDLSKQMTSVKFPVKNLPRGKKFTARAELFGDSGKLLAKASRKFTYPDTSVWMNNNIGRERVVPTPWTPVKTAGDSISCWGRDYIFAPGCGFPEKIITRGKEILAAPVELKLETAKNGKYSNKTGEIASHDKVAAEYEASSQTGGVTVNYKTTVEYDGMIRIDFTLDPKQESTVGKLQLRIPVKAEYGKYLGATVCCGAGQRSYNYYGKLPDGGYKNEFMPFIWVGDEDRGLLWFCQSAKGWRLKKKGNALSVQRRNGTVMIAINIIDKPTVVDKKMSYTMGLMATPVRPLPKNWRKYEKKLGFGPTSYEYFAYIPEALKPWSKRIKQYQAEGKIISAYTFLNNVSTNLPEYNLFFEEWKRNPKAKKGKYYLDVVAPEVKSWQDFVIWSYKKGLDDFGIDGLYYDLSWPSPTTSVEHGAYRDENGKIQRFWPIFAMRDIAKRAYVLYRKNNKQTAFIGHCSSNPIALPILSFCDFSLNGEQYAGELHSYMDQIPLDMMRAQFTQRQFGLAPYFLSEIGRSGNKNYTRKTPEPTLEMAALGYLHDVMFWPCFYNGLALKPFQNAKLAFVDDEKNEVEFLPYWSNGKMISCANPNVKVSAYRKPGQLFLIVSNFAKKVSNADIKLDMAKLGVKPVNLEIIDAVNQKPVLFNDSTVTVKIPPRSLRMIKLAPEDPKKVAERKKALEEVAKFKKLPATEAAREYGKFLQGLYKQKKYLLLLAIAEKEIADPKSSLGVKNTSCYQGYLTGNAMRDFNESKIWAERFEKFNQPGSFWHSRGMIYQAAALRRQGKNRAAVKLLSDKVIKQMDPDRQSEAYRETGAAYTSLKQYAKAVAEYQKAAAATPNPVMKTIARLNIGRIFQTQRKYSEALKEYAKVSASNNSYYKTQAITQALEILSVSPKSGDANPWLKQLDKGENLYPYWKGRALIYAGKYLKQAGKTAEAKEKFKQAMAVRGASAWIKNFCKKELSEEDSK